MAKTDIRQIKQRFEIIGNNQALDRNIEKALLIAPTDLTVLITGESGVGKESFPQIIHQNSLRKHGQYIAVNCGAIPEGTIDSELFGHEKGSFTGALSDRKGYFEVADGGTIFLDEVGELPIPTQARLLRVLENGEFIKVGSSKVQKTNVRIVAATNVNLAQAVANGKFREDLYYRLSTVPLVIPPLRERKEDIPLLFRKFASDCAEKYFMPPIQLTEEARKVLVNYRWPGNIRELKNMTERLSIIEQEREISAEVLKTYLSEQDMEQYPVLMPQNEQQYKNFNSEREILYQVLFDMKKDINDLKALVHGNMASSEVRPMPRYDSFDVENLSSQSATQSSTMIRVPDEDSLMHDNIEEAIDYEEQGLSLLDAEKEIIRKALERNGGRRRNAAQELKISERTLYRKIRDYGLDA